MLDVSPACKALQALRTGSCTSGIQSSATSMRASTIWRGVDTLINATWANHQGEMTVSTPRQMVLARIEVADGRVLRVQPPVLKACSALQAGDSSSIAHLFDRLPEAA